MRALISLHGTGIKRVQPNDLEFPFARRYFAPGRAKRGRQPHIEEVRVSRTSDHLLPVHPRRAFSIQRAFDAIDERAQLRRRLRDSRIEEKETLSLTYMSWSRCQAAGMRTMPARARRLIGFAHQLRPVPPRAQR